MQLMELTEFERISLTERFEGLRERLRRVEGLMHPLNALECDLDAFEALIEALPHIVLGRERVVVRYAARTGGADAPMPDGVGVDVVRTTIPPIAKAGRGRGWKGSGEPSRSAMEAAERGADPALDAMAAVGEKA